MRGPAASPRLLSLLLVACAAIRHGAESSTGAFRDAADSRQDGRGTGQTTAMFRARRADYDPRSSSHSRCAAVCGTAAADWGRWSDGGVGGDDGEECGVDLELAGFEEDVRVVSLEVDVGLPDGSADSLRVFALDESFDIEYNVYPQRRRWVGGELVVGVFCPWPQRLGMCGALWCALLQKASSRVGRFVESTRQRCRRPKTPRALAEGMEKEARTHGWFVRFISLSPPSSKRCCFSNKLP